jgi:hypothetical protein
LQKPLWEVRLGPYKRSKKGQGEDEIGWLYSNPLMQGYNPQEIYIQEINR